MKDERQSFVTNVSKHDNKSDYPTIAAILIFIYSFISLAKTLLEHSGTFDFYVGQLLLVILAFFILKRKCGLPIIIIISFAISINLITNFCVNFKDGNILGMMFGLIISLLMNLPEISILLISLKDIGYNGAEKHERKFTYLFFVGCAIYIIFNFILPMLSGTSIEGTELLISFILKMCRITALIMFELWLINSKSIKKDI